jgi:hypothetical protein
LFDILGVDPDEVCDDHTADENLPVEILDSLCEEDPVVHGAPSAPIVFDVEIVAAPSNGTVATQPDGTVTYTPNPGFSGIDAYIYRTTDAFGASITSSVLVSVGTGGGNR